MFSTVAATFLPSNVLIRELQFAGCWNERGLLLTYTYKITKLGTIILVFLVETHYLLHHSVAQMILFWKLVISGHGEKVCVCMNKEIIRGICQEFCQILGSLNKYFVVLFSVMTTDFANTHHKVSYRKIHIP